MLYGFRQDNEYYLATIVHECGMAVSYGKAFFVVPQRGSQEVKKFFC